MPPAEPSVETISELRQLNRLFLDFLRQRPAVAVDRFGLNPATASLLETATASQIDAAASFPRALFRLQLPPTPLPSSDPLALVRGSGEQVLRLVLLNDARNISRMSGYSARLLFRLSDDDVMRLRSSEVDEIVAMSSDETLLQAAFEDLDWFWRELLTESRPEFRRRLLLIGLQPDFSVLPAAGMA